MGFLKDFFSGVFDRLSKTLRRLVAFTLLMFVLGMAVGMNLPLIAQRTGVEPFLFFIGPIVLMVLAYFFVDIAFAIFILFLLGALLLFV